MSRPGPAPRGLSAVELAAVVAELQPLAGSVVLDIVPLASPPQADDLLLCLQRSDPRGSKTFVHIAPGGSRARIATTARRFGVDDFARGPTRDLLQRELEGALLWHVGQPAGERSCVFGFRTRHGERRLVCELFGARGLWALLDAEGRVLALSRQIETDARTLRPGDAYRPPAGRTETHAATASRFEAPVLAAVDAFYTALDLAADAAREHDQLLRAAQRALQKQRDKKKGLGEQLADAGRSQAMRARADLMLAYAHTVPRGAAHMTVPDPERDGELTLELDPSKPVVAQAQSIYEKARRLDDGRVIAEGRLAEATAAVAALEQVLADLAGIATEGAGIAERLAPIREALRPFGVLPTAKPASQPKARPSKDRTDKFRHFVSAEGYTVLVGRDNEQNDELTMRTANGNDLWLHVGGGRAGSHVIVRLPKQKTASLETLLDAATLAVHFSKARGQARIEVVYTQRKHVRKPKGLPAGAVVPANTKTISVHLDEARLRRLLDSSERDADQL